MVRGKIPADLRPQPRDSVFVVPDAPRGSTFMDGDDYQESPLRTLDAYEDEQTLEQLRQKISKLKMQLKETEEAEAREVNDVARSGRNMIEKFAENTMRISGLPNDANTKMDEAVRRNNEIIKYFKEENQKRSDEQKTMKMNLFELRQSTTRLEKATEQALGFLEKLEDVYYKAETDKRKTLLRSMAACKEGNQRLTEELQRRIFYVDAEVRVRQLYEVRTTEILSLFVEKYAGTPLLQLLNEMAAGKHDERLDDLLRYFQGESSGEAEKVEETTTQAVLVESR